VCFDHREKEIDWKEDLNLKRRALLTEKDYVKVQEHKAGHFLALLPFP
jgi:hypothetical protein